jgi:hypothetical protein
VQRQRPIVSSPAKAKTGSIESARARQMYPPLARSGISDPAAASYSDAAAARASGRRTANGSLIRDRPLVVYLIF